MTWLERAAKISKRPNTHAETIKGVREELAELLHHELNIISGMLDSSISDDNRFKLIQQLKSLIDRLESDD